MRQRAAGEHFASARPTTGVVVADATPRQAR